MLRGGAVSFGAFFFYERKPYRACAVLPVGENVAAIFGALVLRQRRERAKPLEFFCGKVSFANVNFPCAGKLFKKARNNVVVFVGAERTS